MSSITDQSLPAAIIKQLAADPFQNYATATLEQGLIQGSIDIRSALCEFILSASGWRKVFACTDENRDIHIRLEDAILVALMGRVFFDYVQNTAKKLRPAKADCPLCLCIGMDTRPTGPVIAAILIRVFAERGAEIRFLHISATPEICAYTKTDPAVDAFVYVSASHNPLGHNGIKFGSHDGKVIGGEASQRLIQAFRDAADDPSLLIAAVHSARFKQRKRLEAIALAQTEWKEKALTAYSGFLREVITGSPMEEEQQQRIELLRKGIRDRGFGILGDLNGSARTRSIDAKYLASLGLDTVFINAEAGEVNHAILPEGESLDPCREELTRVYAKRPAFQLAYVPDNDGDRGNLVYIDTYDGLAYPVEAQSVFALACLAELLWLEYWEGPDACAAGAIVVNGPTSMRIEAIAACFGTQVFRAEVGEANVVGLAEQCNEQGKRVRVLGEGSNGGTIIYPSGVRDPLSSLSGILKLLCFSEETRNNPFYMRWYELRGYNPDTITRPNLADWLRSLPPYRTTGTGESRAVLRFNSVNHAQLKAAYEELLQKEWHHHQAQLQDIIGQVEWEEINYEGTAAKHGLGPRFRSGEERGGLKILFTDSDGQHPAFVWMRGSGTEPVFRILADLAGSDREQEARLLAWHRNLVERAAGKG